MPQITSRQHLTVICQQAYETWPDVHAILLFGSRAKGTARPDSDWDIAVVVDDPKMKHVIQSKRTPPPAPFDGYTNLDVLTLTPDIIVQDRCAFGRINDTIISKRVHQFYPSLCVRRHRRHINQPINPYQEYMGKWSGSKEYVQAL